MKKPPAERPGKLTASGYTKRGYFTMTPDERLELDVIFAAEAEQSRLGGGGGGAGPADERPSGQPVDPAAHLFDQKLSSEERQQAINDLTPEAHAALTAFLDTMATERTRKAAAPAPKTEEPSFRAPYPVLADPPKHHAASWYIFGMLVGNHVMPVPDPGKPGREEDLAMVIGLISEALDKIKYDLL